MAARNTHRWSWVGMTSVPLQGRAPERIRRETALEVTDSRVRVETGDVILKTLVQIPGFSHGGNGVLDLG